MEVKRAHGAVRRGSRGCSPPFQCLFSQIRPWRMTIGEGGKLVKNGAVRIGEGQRGRSCRHGARLQICQLKNNTMEWKSPVT